MSRSTSNKQDELSIIKQRVLEAKQQLIREIQQCCESYDHLFIFSVNDMRNYKLKDVRQEWKDSRFFFGKNKIMAMALGRTPEKEYKPNIHKVSSKIVGQRGLLFSNRPSEEIIQWFSSYADSDFARSKNVATANVALSKGPLSDIPPSSKSNLRGLGLPIELRDGVVYLQEDFVVCTKGDILSPETAKILELLGHQMSEFRIQIECVWSQDGSFHDLVPEVKDNVIKVKCDPPPERKRKSKSVRSKRDVVVSYRNIDSADKEITQMLPVDVENANGAGDKEVIEQSCIEVKCSPPAKKKRKSKSVRSKRDVVRSCRNNDLADREITQMLPVDVENAGAEDMEFVNEGDMVVPTHVPSEKSLTKLSPKLSRMVEQATNLKHNDGKSKRKRKNNSHTDNPKENDMVLPKHEPSLDQSLSELSPRMARVIELETKPKHKDSRSKRKKTTDDFYTDGAKDMIVVQEKDNVLATHVSSDQSFSKLCLGLARLVEHERKPKRKDGKSKRKKITHSDSAEDMGVIEKEDKLLSIHVPLDQSPPELSPFTPKLAERKTKLKHRKDKLKRKNKTHLSHTDDGKDVKLSGEGESLVKQLPSDGFQSPPRLSPYTPIEKIKGRTAFINPY